MLLIPIILFPICFVLSFFTRKNRTVFLSILTIGTLTFLMILCLLLDSKIYIHHAYTASALSNGLCIIYFIGYEFLWLFMPIRWYDRLFPILIFGTFLFILKSSIIFSQIIFGLSCIYFIYFYLKYILTDSSLIFIQQNLVKHKTKKKRNINLILF